MGGVGLIGVIGPKGENGRSGITGMMVGVIERVNLLVVIVKYKRSL